MHWFLDLIGNPFLLTAMSSWLFAQILKAILHMIINRRFDIHRLFGDGGMPSGHSATVSSLAMFSALVYGPSSFQFAIAAVFAIIVCHDAMGVRQETGKQAVLINEMIKSFEILSSKELPEVKLKEFVGHTPIQVLAGVLLGVANALLMYAILI